MLPPSESDMDPFVDLNTGRRTPVPPVIPPSQPSTHELEKTHATPKPALVQPCTTSSTPRIVNFEELPQQEGNIPQVSRQQLMAMTKMSPEQLQAILPTCNKKQNQVTLKVIPPTDTSNFTASGIAPALDKGAVASSGRLHVPAAAQPRKAVPVSQEGTLPILFELNKTANHIELYPSRPEALFEDG